MTFHLWNFAGVLFVLLTLTLAFGLACGREEEGTPPDSAQMPIGSTTPAGNSTGRDEGSVRQGNATPAQTATSTPLASFADEAIDGDYDYDDDGLIEVRTLAQLHAMRLDPKSTGLIHAGREQYFEAFPGTGGQSGCPNQICTGYELAAHLDFDTNGNGEADQGDDYWNDGAGWEPLTLSGGATFDGNGYAIFNLYINGHDSDLVEIGLFSQNAGEINNVLLEGVHVKGPGNVASLVYNNSGTISGSTVKGKVTSSGAGAGGLVYTNSGTISSSTVKGKVTSSGAGAGGLVYTNIGIIERSVFNGEVLAPTSAGGLAVENQEGATITRSRAHGVVTAFLKHWRVVSPRGDIRDLSEDVGNVIGGLVATNSGTINSSVAANDVSGINAVGGLVGHNLGTIDGNRAVGTVSGNKNVGGLVGTNGHRLTPTTGGNVIFGPSAISSAQALGDVFGRVNVGGLVGFAQAGRSIVENSHARGRVTGSRYVGGLIGLNQGAVRGSGANGNITGSENVGGLVGHNDHSPRSFRASITRSRANGNVIGISNVGGLVGYNKGSIAESTASGDVAGNAYRGGLVGVNDRGTIEGSEESGTVSLNEAPGLQADKDVLTSLGLSANDVLFNEHGRVIAILGGKEISLSSEIAKLDDLEHLEVTVSGQLPPELGNLASLQALGMKVTGGGQAGSSIPPELGNLANLKSLHLSGNGLKGSIPPELGNLAELESLHLSGKRLTGDIPQELGKLSNLYVLGIWGPSGCIPENLESVYVKLGESPFCTGPVKTPVPTNQATTSSATTHPTPEGTATPAVSAGTPSPLTAAFSDPPVSHDGRNPFTFELSFSEEFELSYVTLRDHAFTVNGGEVIQARRLDKPGNIRWEIGVRPDSDDSVTVVLPATADCAAEGAICTSDGRRLSSRLELTVPGSER